MSTELFLKNMEKVIEQTRKNHPENESMIQIFAPMLICEERFLLENPLKRVNVQDKKDTPLWIDFSKITLDVKKVGILKKELCAIMHNVLPQFSAYIDILEANLSNAKLKSMCSALILKEKTQPEVIADFLDTTLMPSLLKKKEDFAKCMPKSKEDWKHVMQSLLEILLSRLQHIFLNRYARAIKAQKEKREEAEKGEQDKKIPFEEKERITQTLPPYVLESPTCPYCGSSPSMSIIHTQEGKRDLLCPSCGQTWRFKRTTCPHCLTEEQNNLQSIYKDTAVQTETKLGIIEKDKNLGVSSSGISERAIYCEKCNHYLLELDLREKNSSFEHIAILSLGMAYLDAIMLNRGAKRF